MINLLAQIDYAASTGRSVWHRASALTKLVLAAATIAAAITAPRLDALLAVHLFAWALALTSGLAPRLLLTAAAYPLMFSLLVAAGRWDGTWTTPLMLLMRPVGAGLVSVWLLGTTPYPDVFAPISRVLPRRAGDGLFLTYRALFALLTRTDQVWRALRLRGGLAVPARRRLAHAGDGLGLLVVYSAERSRRLYETMRLRGHTGRVCGCRHWAEVGPRDLVVLGAFAVLVAITTFGWWRAQ
ncbi:MAG: hypothetical protein HOP12_08315 [Candidatus Eisenbacteria bacterium]|uniref:Cobalt ECF transporter T component CbiQ n=1 Tax=Eiseniibacteriota bacterium TaxID=2212470 RepID=A0A849SHV0_UNCEI|nr:hypothetical protein [Candidatus Eisenbacteria bacterium]